MADGPPLNGRGEVRAAGGLVWRRPPGAGLEVLVVHRPRYDDWSIPKGKAEPGESDEDCALREVQEETGLRCRLGEELAGASYVDRRGRPKAVRYWAMEVVAEAGPAEGAGHGTTPSGDGVEVDEVRWLSPSEARARLSYERDREVVAGFADRPR